MGQEWRKKKIVLSCIMAGFFIWVLYASWRAEPADEMPDTGVIALRVIELELETAVLTSRPESESRTRLLASLSQRFHNEARKDPLNMVLQVEDAILRYEADRYRGDTISANAYFAGLPNRDLALVETVRHIYGLAEREVPDVDLFLNRLGTNWFSLTALAHYADRIGNEAMLRRYQESLKGLAWRTARRTGFISLVLAGATFAGLWLWIRFIYRRLTGDLTRTEIILPRAPWNFLDGCFVFLLFFSALTALSSLLNPLYRIFDQWGFSTASLVPILYGMQMVLGLFLIRRFFFAQNLGQAFRTMGLFSARDAWPATLRWGVGGYAATVPLVLLALYLSSLLLRQAPISGNPMIPMVVASSSFSEKILFFLTIGIMAPFFEEIFFRGFLFNAFRVRLGTMGGVLLSAFLFAAVHFDFSVFLGLFAIGIMLSIVYHQTQNLLTAIILHGLWNMTTLVTLELLFG
ncbi:MAG: CPBP family intramembrane glutamic endopeptidase [bacterium]|nr:CPBP family intramembrane glutamic endopeptidase [bacterium]